MAEQAKIRVLVVDDAVVIRKVLADALCADPELELAGLAPDGRVALAKIAQNPPDLVTLDVAMPVMNGLETLKEIRKLYPKLPVIMFSALTGPGAAVTLDALALGASDFTPKPDSDGSPAAAVERIRSELIPKIKALCRPAAKPASSARPRIIAPRRESTQQIDVVAIGTSTGGPNALAALLPAIPKDFPVPILAVQHMPPIFTRLLAERLSTRAQIPVEEGQDGAELQPGQAWIAPGNFHMVAKRNGASVRLELNQEKPENSCRPAVDVLFRSVAATYGRGVLAVVMTGMGSDGVAGSKAVREAGGTVIVQDEASSVVWGMPGLTYAAGVTDGVFALDKLGPEITRRVMQSRSKGTISRSSTLVVTEPQVP